MREIRVDCADEKVFPAYCKIVVQNNDGSNISVKTDCFLLNDEKCPCVRFPDVGRHLRNVLAPIDVVPSRSMIIWLLVR